jgi:hypothetical protein
MFLWRTRLSVCLANNVRLFTGLKDEELIERVAAIAREVGLRIHPSAPAPALAK